MKNLRVGFGILIAAAGGFILIGTAGARVRGSDFAGRYRADDSRLERAERATADSQQSGADGGKVVDSEESLGAFGIVDQKFSVVAHRKSLARGNSGDVASTITELKIFDGAGNVAFQQKFANADGRLEPRLNVYASLLGGGTNAAIVIRYAEQASPGHENNSFQVFGLVGGKLTAFGAPVPLGQAGTDTAAGNVLTGVMVGGGVDVEPLMSTAEVLRFRAWTGNFLVDIPVRVDWAHGKWSEGEECFGLANGGSPQRRGCNLGIAGNPVGRADGATVTIYGAPVEDHYNQQTVAVGGKAFVEILGLQAVVNWKNDGDRFGCGFENLWLHVRVDGKEGWTHTQGDFAALGFGGGEWPR